VRWQRQWPQASARYIGLSEVSVDEIQPRAACAPRDVGAVRVSPGLVTCCPGVPYCRAQGIAAAAILATVTAPRRTFSSFDAPAGG